MQQFELDFDGGLIERFVDFEECVKASVSGCGRQLKAVAAELNMGSSELSRRLAANPGDISLPLYRLPELLAATGDLTPIYWLVERFCDDPEARDRKNRAQLAELLPKLTKLAAMVAK